MNMQLPTWLRRSPTTTPATKGNAAAPPPPSPETPADVRHRLEAARGDVAEAEAAVRQAVNDFADARSEAALEALDAARRKVERLRTMASIVEGDLRRAEETEAAEKRAALVARRDQLEAQLASEAVVAGVAPFVAAEVATKRSYEEACEAREQFARGLTELHHEHVRVLDQLGELVTETRHVDRGDGSSVIIHPPRDPSELARAEITALQRWLRERNDQHAS